jgi:hypothetical protein
VSNGNVSQSCWMTHAAAGWSVTSNRRTRCRSCSIANQMYKILKVTVGTAKKSIAAITSRCLRREHKPARQGVGTGWTPRQVPRDGALGHVEAEHDQLAVDPWRSPGRILRHNPADQVADAPVYRWPPRSPVPTREPCPVEPEARSMPAGDRRRQFIAVLTDP